MCRLNSSVCNSKQIKNSDTCRCDCNEDFAGIINCNEGYMWNPSTCECQCDRWCKTGQYLDHKNCVCKNKLVGRLVEECTSIINETMINNKYSCNNTLRNVFIGLFSVAVLIGIICFCMFAYFRWFKSKNLKNILIIKYIKMEIEQLKIKNQNNYNWDDIIYINDFDKDLLKIIKRESKIGINIYYIKYSTLRTFYFVINHLIGFIEEIERSSDKYLVVPTSSRNKNINTLLDNMCESIEDQINPITKIKNCNKLRFNSDMDLPLNTKIEFHSLVINISCIIEKDNKYYPEIYLEECLYVKDNTWYIKPTLSVDLFSRDPFSTKKTCLL